MGRVLILENNLLLGAGVKSLLSSQANLEPIGIVPNNEIELIRHIEHFRPEVIILSKTTRLTNPIRLLDLSQNYPNLRVIVVSADENWVQVYDKWQVLVTQVTDLVGIVRHNHNNMA